MIRIFLSHYIVMMGIVVSTVHVVRHLNSNSEGLIHCNEGLNIAMGGKNIVWGHGLNNPQNREVGNEDSEDYTMIYAAWFDLT